MIENILLFCAVAYYLTAFCVAIWYIRKTNKEREEQERKERKKRRSIEMADEKPKAKWIKCSKGQEIEHLNLDFCSNCAPFWDNYPVCEQHGNHKLNKSGYCHKGKHYLNLGEKVNP